jgi:hypothetical protein
MTQRQRERKDAEWRERTDALRQQHAAEGYAPNGASTEG